MVVTTVPPIIRIRIGTAVGVGVVLIGVIGTVVGDGAVAGVGAAAGVEDGAVAGMEVGTAAAGTGNSITLFNLRKICSRALSSGAFF